MTDDRKTSKSLSGNGVWLSDHVAPAYLTRLGD